MILSSIVLITLFLPKQPRFRYEFEKGKVWMHEDLISPYNFAVLKTQAELEKERENVLKSVYPIYDHNTQIAEQQIAQFEADLPEKWQAAGLDTLNIDVATYEQTGKKLLTDIYRRGVIALNNKFQGDRTHYNFTLLTDHVAKQMNTAAVFTTETAAEYISKTINGRTAIKQKEWFIDVIGSYISVNYLFNESLTARLEEDALASISTTRGMVQRGELIVANGTTVNNEIYQKIESLRKAYEEEARIGGNRALVMLGQFFIVALVVSLLFVFIYLFRKDIYHNNRLIFLILIVITGMLLVLSWAIKIKLPSLYYIPYCIVPIIIRILFDTRLALNIHLLMVLLAAFFVPNSFEFVFLQFSAGMVAIYSIKTLVKREQFLISSAIILGTYLIAYIGMGLMRDGSLGNLYWSDIAPFVFSVLLTLLAYPLIYAFERLFGIISDVTLMELTNSNSKLLRELSYKAPGTFQHSMQVANLAEAAIYKIGGNTLLVRAGALYHDIGKMFNPQYFIENQTKGHNPHDGLSFEQSAQIIISHVAKGVELARKNQLPEVIIDFIRTHHGTTRVDYFYQSYIKSFPEKFVDEDIFHYPGPVPFSRETAVLMMADSVEAASRSLKEPSAQSLNDLVDKIIESKLNQKQLVNSNITLKDITMVSEIFKDMLKSIYHVRIDYDTSGKKSNTTTKVNMETPHTN
ncbi:HDIG domain-containing protein [Parapedobacter sp. ISTM3]|uniref:HD family phosphohydrolase n=1 Tax=Parapedobacter sp. ISTM3 TaxID=2800130 RepID=UPI00190826E6|nr:HDIG domain-containing metalloprotein [Parapedobacter sp. ISTM3]MBK1441926.1 HDIG domain-containing protein [Parapedobacter sp. ISTM3]